MVPASIQEPSEARSTRHVVSEHEGHEGPGQVVARGVALPRRRDAERARHAHVHRGVRGTGAQAARRGGRHRPRPLGAQPVPHQGNGQAPDDHPWRVRTGVRAPARSGQLLDPHADRRRQRQLLAAKPHFPSGEWGVLLKMETCYT